MLLMLCDGMGHGELAHRQSEKTLELLLDCAGGMLTLTEYPRENAFFERLRERVNVAILAQSGQ